MLQNRERKQAGHGFHLRLPHKKEIYRPAKIESVIPLATSRGSVPTTTCRGAGGGFFKKESHSRARWMMRVYVGAGADVDSKEAARFYSAPSGLNGRGPKFEPKTDVALVKALGSVLLFWINIYFCISGMVITYEKGFDWGPANSEV
jgi:hypothetical protein